MNLSKMKVSLTPKDLRRTVKEYLFITFGIALYAVSWVSIIMPAKLVGGGVTGMAMLAEYFTDGAFKLQYGMFALNAVLIVAATIIIGFQFSTKTIYAVILMPIMVGVFRGIIPPDFLQLADDRLLSALLAGVVAGLGISINFSQGGSSGGTDIIAMIINKFRPVSYGKVIMFCDFIIVGLSYFTGNGIETVIYSLIIVGSLGYTIDAVLNGSKQSSQIFIISKYYEDIARALVEDANRGVTMIDAAGWYTKQQMKMIVVVARKTESSSLLRMVRDIDPEAFITVGSVMGVYGKGFDPLTNLGKGRKKRALRAAAKAE
jgi:uncharacterized membrane-anchored protein YitT (DUF2179 family)